jgi:hypothetical protein
MKYLAVLACLLLSSCVSHKFLVTGTIVPPGDPIEDQVAVCVEETCKGFTYFVGFKPADDDTVAKEDSASGWCYCATKTQVLPQGESFNRYRF